MNAFRFFRDHAELDAQVIFDSLPPDAAGHTWLTTRHDGVGTVRLVVPAMLLRRTCDVFRTTPRQLAHAEVGRVAHALGVPPATLRAYRGPLPIRHGRIEIFNGERWRAAA